VAVLEDIQQLVIAKVYREVLVGVLVMVSLQEVELVLLTKVIVEVLRYQYLDGVVQEVAEQELLEVQVQLQLEALEVQV
jgi:hypothetical protein